MKIFSFLLLVLLFVGCGGKQPTPDKILVVETQEITVVEPCDPPVVICDLSIDKKGTQNEEDKQVIGKLVACISEQKRALYVCSKKALDAKFLKESLKK